MPDEIRPRPSIRPPYIQPVDLLRSIYSDARVPADIRLTIGTNQRWLPHDATIDQLPTPSVTDDAGQVRSAEITYADTLGHRGTATIEIPPGKSRLYARNTTDGEWKFEFVPIDDTPVELRISLFHQFGRVCTAGTRIPVESLWEAVAAGDSVDGTAEAFGVRRADVLMACWWAAGREPAVRHWDGSAWADKVEHATYGQRADTVDWAAIPDPPAIEQPNKRNR